MSELTSKLSLAATAVLEALPNQFDFDGPSARALAESVSQLANEVELLIQAIWGFDDQHAG